MSQIVPGHTNEIQVKKSPAKKIPGAPGKYNLVEKKKRKVRSGKKRGPQEQFIFHLKLEEQKKKRAKQQTRNTMPQPFIPTIPNYTPPVLPQQILPRQHGIIPTTQPQSQPFQTQSNEKFSTAQTMNYSPTLNQTINPNIPLTSQNIPPAHLQQFSNQFNQSFNPQDFYNQILQNYHPTSSVKSPQFHRQTTQTVLPQNQSTLPSKQQKIEEPEELNLQNYRFPLTTDNQTQNQTRNIPLDTSEEREIQNTTQLHQATINYQRQRRNSIIYSIVTGLHQAKSPTTVTLTDGCIVKTNEAFCVLLGYTAKQLESTMIQNIIHPDDKNINNLLLLQMLAANSDTCTHDIRLVTGSRRVIKVVQEVCCIRNNNGIPQWLVTRMTSHQLLDEYVPEDKMNYQRCICHHKSDCDRVLFNEEPAPFCEMFVGVLERLFGLSQPTCFFDAESVILWNNDSFDTLFGVKGRPFIGRKATEIDHMKGTAMEILTKSVLQEQPPTLECQFVPTTCPSLGKKLAVRCYGQRIDKQDGSLFGYLWLFAIISHDDDTGTEILQQQSPLDSFTT